MEKRLNRLQRMHGEPITHFRDAKDNIIVDVGDCIEWDTVGGEHYEGTIIAMDSDVAIVRDKKTKAKLTLEL